MYARSRAMSYVRSFATALLLTVVFCLGVKTAPDAANAKAFDKRPVTVADAIAMSRVAGPADSSSFLGGAPIKEFASFSPDGKRFAIVLRKGNVEDNTNKYSLFVLRADEVFNHFTPKLLVTFSSSSNREGIKHVTWLRDNDTILFLGENPGELTQLFEIRCSSGKLKRLTNHPTNVTSYSLSDNGERIAYAAEPPTRNLATEQIVHRGFHVPANVDLADLLAGHLLQGGSDGCELFVLKKGTAKYKALKVLGSLLFPTPYLALSPDGNYLIVKTMVRSIDPSWREYDSPDLKRVLERNLPKGSVTFTWGYELLDIERGISKPLIDAPIGDSGSDLVWSPDSQSVLATGVYLPLNVPNQEEREARRAHTFAVEVTIPDRRINKITDQALRLVGYVQQANAWKFETRGDKDETTGPLANVYYRKGPAGWRRVEDVSLKNSQPEPNIFVDEDLNVPPRIVAENPETRQRVVLFDLNPQFETISFGRVEEIKWHDTEGHEIIGGLYFPRDYVVGTKYPLVIQTHGYRSHEFWIDGPYTTAFAAQPLASKGFAVLQLPEPAAGTREEGQRNLLAFESGIDYLDRKGLVDVNRVGLVGFSRTCYHVKYTLIHSRFHFAAATVADGIDAGYFQFITFANEAPNGVAEIKMLVGAAPFGEGLSVWLKNSPGFLLDKVNSPILIQATRPISLLTEWEWFSGLSQLGKAVDLLYIPTGEHILEKPWDRLASQQTSVDWFLFWLKGEEDPDPAKADQYARWRELRKLQQQNARQPQQASPPPVR